MYREFISKLRLLFSCLFFEVDIENLPEVKKNEYELMLAKADEMFKIKNFFLMLIAMFISSFAWEGIYFAVVRQMLNTLSLDKSRQLDISVVEDVFCQGFENMMNINFVLIILGTLAFICFVAWFLLEEDKKLSLRIIRFNYILLGNIIGCMTFIYIMSDILGLSIRFV